MIDLTPSERVTADAADEAGELLAAWAADEGLAEGGGAKADDMLGAACGDGKEDSDDHRYDASTDEEEAVIPRVAYCRGSLASWIVGRRRAMGARDQNGHRRRGASAQKRGHKKSRDGHRGRDGALDGSADETGAAASAEGSEGELIEWEFDPVMRRGRWHDKRGRTVTGDDAAAGEGAAVPQAQTGSATGVQPGRHPHHGAAPQDGGGDGTARAHAAGRDERGQTSEGSPSPSRGKRKQPPCPSQGSVGAEGGESLREPD